MMQANSCCSQGLGVTGLPLEDDSVVITSAQIMEINQNLPHVKNSSSLTFLSINIVLKSHVIRHATVLLKIVHN